MRSVALPAAAVLSHSYATPFTSTSLYRRERAEQDGANNRGNSNFSLYTKPSRIRTLKNHTQQQRGVTQTFWESRCFKAIRALFQSDTQNLTTFFNRSVFCWLGYQVSPATVSNVNTIHTKPIRLPISKLWPLVKLAIYILRPLSTRCNS